MYTCLSRGSTYHGTAIVQGFTASKVQTGINGYLRQEFRELEMLNDITKLYYDCQLPATVGGVTRKQVIYTFRQWKGQNYVPENVSEHITWSENSPWGNDEPGEEDIFVLVQESSKSKKQKTGVNGSTEKKTRQPKTVPVYIDAKGSTTLQALSMDQRPKMKRKRQANDQPPTTESKAKKLRLIPVPTQAAAETIQKEWGFKWHDNSCAYDTILPIIITSILATSIPTMRNALACTPLIESLVVYYQQLQETQQDVEKARDTLHMQLHGLAPIEFPVNSSLGTEINVLCSYLCEQSADYLFKECKCKPCKRAAHGHNTAYNNLTIMCSSYYWRKQGIMSKSANYKSPLNWFKAAIKQTFNIQCAYCSRVLWQQVVFKSMPVFLRFKVENVTVKWSLVLDLHKCKFNCVA